MLITNGGPVLMVQIDSDLGETQPCVTTDWLSEIYQQYLGHKTIMFTMDNNNSSNLKCGKLKNTISAFRVNPYEYFTTFKQSLGKLYSPLRQLSPNSPKLVEIRTGLPWNWKSERFTFGGEKILKTIKDVIKSDASIIVYMFAGGTNFERAGKSDANTIGLTTSYDFDAIITESGDLTKKFYKLQSKLHSSFISDEKEPPEEDGRGTIDISGQLNFTILGSLLDPDFRSYLGMVTIKSEYPKTFANLNITDGLVLYEVTVPKISKVVSSEATLHSKDIRDRGYVYSQDNLLGILDPDHQNLQIPVQLTTMHILVENTGYLAQNVIGEPKGIIGNVSLNGQILKDWNIHPFAFDIEKLQQMAKSIKIKKPRNREISFLLAKFQIQDQITNSTLRTYLNMNHQSAKGYVFLNEYSVGKYSLNGPQNELYIPECYFKKHPIENQLLIIEVQKERMYYDGNGKENIVKKKTKTLDKSGDSSKNDDNEYFITYVMLFYICWFWRPGYSCICC